MKLVGEVDQKVITSRDVEAYNLVTRILEGGSTAPLKLNDSEFNIACDRFIVETMVFGEAQSFGIAKLTDEEVDAVYKTVKSKVNEASLKNRWQAWGFSDSQLKHFVTMHLRAEKLIRYRSESSTSQVSDEEARDYFDKNKVKFGTTDFDSFKPTIKKFIARRNSEARMKEWLDILKKKHKVKKLYSESN